MDTRHGYYRPHISLLRPGEMDAIKTILALALVGLASAAKPTTEYDNLNNRSSAERVDTGYTSGDPNPHYVDLKALREMSIKAYMEGGNYDDLHEWGINRRDMSLSICFTILFFTLIMTCCCNQCQKHLMRDFYKLEFKARMEAEARAMERR